MEQTAKINHHTVGCSVFVRLIPRNGRQFYQAVNLAHVVLLELAEDKETKMFGIVFKFANTREISWIIGEYKEACALFDELLTLSQS